MRRSARRVPVVASHRHATPDAVATNSEPLRFGHRVPLAPGMRRLLLSRRSAEVWCRGFGCGDASGSQLRGCCRAATTERQGEHSTSLRNSSFACERDVPGLPATAVPGVHNPERSHAPECIHTCRWWGVCGRKTPRKRPLRPDQPGRSHGKRASLASGGSVPSTDKPA